MGTLRDGMRDWLYVLQPLLSILSPRFKNFGLSRNSLNPTLRPSLRPNSDRPWLVLVENKELNVEECANSYHYNQPNIILNWFFKLNSVENKMQLESIAQVVNKVQRLLRPEPYFLKGIESLPQTLIL